MNATKISLLILGIAIVASVLILAPKNKQVVAKVNNESIPESELQVKYDQTLKILSSLSSETEITEEQKSQIRQDVLNELISIRLIKQYAEENNIEVTSEEIEQEYQLVFATSGGEEQFNAQLEKFGITEDQFMTDLENDLIRRKSVENYTDPTLLEVSEDEVKSTYDSLLAQSEASEQAEDLPPYEEAREYLLSQLKNQKILQNLESFVGDLKSKAEIEILI